MTTFERQGCRRFALSISVIFSKTARTPLWEIAFYVGSVVNGNVLVGITMEATKKQFLAELLLHPVDLLASIWIIDRIPVIFDGDMAAYATWRRELSKRLGVDASAVLITGSAAFGVSLNPYKNYRFFDEQSDIDVAVISDYHFGEGWRALRNIGSARHSLPPKVKQSITDHVNKYIYWGTIATDKILPLLPYGQTWKKSLEEIATVTPTMGRSIKVRIYKDFDSLRAYHVNNLTYLKTEQLSKGIE